MQRSAEDDLSFGDVTEVWYGMGLIILGMVNIGNCVMEPSSFSLPALSYIVAGSVYR